MSDRWDALNQHGCLPDAMEVLSASDLAGWIAPSATMLAATMTAANLGTRVTGWGFIVFTLGSIAWVTVAIGTGQQNLLLSNGFLTLVNVVGIWRWLGRQARYEDGSRAASAKSAIARVPTLFSVQSIAGARLVGRDGAALGTIVDGMMRCAGSELAYVVVSEGGVGGVGERLRALAPTELHFSADGPSCDLTADELARRPELKQGAWPVSIDDPEMPRAAR